MLGNGSHSTVYKGRFRGIDRFVVVKLFELAEDGETLKLVLDEFRIMMLLQDTMVAPTVFGIVQNDRSLSAPVRARGVKVENVHLRIPSVIVKGD